MVSREMDMVVLDDSKDNSCSGKKKVFILALILAAVAFGVFLMISTSVNKADSDPFFTEVEKQYFSIFSRMFPDPDEYVFHSLEVFSIKDENIPKRFRYFFHARYKGYFVMSEEWAEIEEVTYGDSSGIEGFYCLTWDSIEGFETINEEYNYAVREGQRKEYTQEEIHTLIEQNKYQD